MATQRVYAYECGIRGTEWTSVVHASSAGKARYRYLLEVGDTNDGLSFKDITVRSLGNPITDAEFERTAKYRGVPFAKIGMRVECEGSAGLIVGKNSSANFNVLFTFGRHQGCVMNCHPNWKMRYFDENGQLIQEF